MASGSHQPPSSQVQGWGKRSPAEYVEGESLVEMVHEDLIVRRISIDGCRDIIQYLRGQEAPMRHRLEGILAIKGERAGDAENRVARMAVVRIVADIERKNARTMITMGWPRWRTYLTGSRPENAWHGCLRRNTLFRGGCVGNGYGVTH